MYRKNDVIYINHNSLTGIANRWFKGDKREAKAALLKCYNGRTIRFTDIWRAA